MLACTQISGWLRPSEELHRLGRRRGRPCPVHWTKERWLQPILPLSAAIAGACLSSLCGLLRVCSRDVWQGEDPKVLGWRSQRWAWRPRTP